MKLTSTHGVIAMRGSGKTFRSMWIAEQMLDFGGQVVVVDPTGAWWGLRLSRDGKSVHFPQLLVLGANGSMPLNDNMGEAVAKLVVNKRLSVVLDLSDMSNAGMRRFVAAFLKELIRTNPKRPVHTFFDEADLFAPEKAMGEVAHCLGAMSAYFRRGRNKGLGGTLITQRVQAIAKDILWQCEAMTVMRLKGTHDIKAIKEWLDSNGYPAKAMSAELPKLAQGEHYWCLSGVAERITAEGFHRQTFDSSRTPEADEDPVAPPSLDAADLQVIREQLGEAVAEIEANDPTALKKRIAQLEKEKREACAGPATIEVLPEAWLDKAGKFLRIDIEKLKQQAERVNDDMGKLIDRANTLNEGWELLVKELREGPAVGPREFGNLMNMAQAMADKHYGAVPPQFEDPDEDPVVDAGNMSARCRSLLIVLAQAGKPLDRRVLALYAQYTPRASSFLNNVSALRTAGYLQPGWPATLTEKGKRATKDVKPGIHVHGLRLNWMGQLSEKQREIFEKIQVMGPITREALAFNTSYTPRASSFLNNVSKLRTLGLVQKGWPAQLVEELK